jgi:hypothetical protein
MNKKYAKTFCLAIVDKNKPGLLVLKQDITYPVNKSIGKDYQLTR